MFQLFEDLLARTKVNVPEGWFGLFVDGRSFLEFFSLSGYSYIDTEAKSNSQKAGFAMYI